MPRTDAFEQQQQRKRRDRKIQCVIERVDEHHHAKHQAHPAGDLQRAPAGAQVIDAQQDHDETNHRKPSVTGTHF
jgi:hypothetical protein